MEIDPSIQAGLVSAATAVLVLILGKLVTSRLEKSQAAFSDSEAAESLANAAKIQIEVYQREVITPLRQRIDELSIRLGQMQNKIDELNAEIDHLKGELRRGDQALEYAISVAKLSYPSEMEKAIKMRRGEL